MTATAPDIPEKGNEGIHEWRARCERCRDMLHELACVHLEIDAPTRRMRADDPDWIGCMRKIRLHVVALNVWEIGRDVEHVLATEIRAAYQQMDAVWKQLPETLRLDEIDGNQWAREARKGVLSVYDHPTPQSLLLPAGYGGLGNGESRRTYMELAVWMGRLGLGYALALPYLAQELGVKADAEPRVTAAFARICDLLLEIARSGAETCVSP